MSRGTLESVRSLRFSLTGLSPSPAGFPKTVLLTFKSLVTVLTRSCTHDRLGSFHFARRYSGNRCFFLFLRVLRCFSSPGSPCMAIKLCFVYHTVHRVFLCGFPHSDICGSPDICSSPQLFAAYHVFLRLLVPRHPPCALSSLTFFFV